MRGITRNTLVACGLALCVAGLLTGCSKSEDTTPTATPAAAAPAAPTSSAKPAGGGAIASPSADNAPSGVETGNYAGGKKN
jgi:hypothetical protein